MTPPEEYRKLDEEFHFNFDPCPLNHDVTLWDGLKIEWKERNFINPPYSDLKATGRLKSSFVKKAIEESKKGKLCVMLLPVSTGTKLFHDYILPNVTKIRWVKGRIPFIGQNDKGQFINHHLIREIQNPDQKISYKDPKTGKLHILDKYAKNTGQHDSMIVIFGEI